MKINKLINDKRVLLAFLPGGFIPKINFFYHETAANLIEPATK